MELIYSAERALRRQLSDTNVNAYKEVREAISEYFAADPKRLSFNVLIIGLKPSQSRSGQPESFSLYPDDLKIN